MSGVNFTHEGFNAVKPPATEWSWMQWLPFKIYDALPHFPNYGPSPFMLSNIGFQFNAIAWHSRYHTVFPHTLAYRMMRAIASNDLEEVATILNKS